MTSDSQVSPSARLLVALESSAPNEQALRMVCTLMGPDGLDVTALYVEDQDLLSAANLPGLREISLSGEQTTLDPARVARDMAVEAATVRRAFEALAERLNIEHRRLHHRFRVARGHMAEELGRAAADSDFVMITRSLKGNCLQSRLGRSFTPLVRQHKHVLFINEPWASGSSVVVLDGGDLALGYAARLAESEHLRLVVATAAGQLDRDRLPANATIRNLAEQDEASIAALCVQEDARLLVLAERPDLDWVELLVSLMDKLPCSMLKLATETRAGSS